MLLSLILNHSFILNFRAEAFVNILFCSIVSRRDVEKLMALPHITRRWTAIDTICHTISDAATVDYRESLNIGCFLGCKESFYAKAKKDDEIMLRLSIIVRGEYL